jgi:hypothetical protein
MRYVKNLRAWRTGFSRFGELKFHAGWSADQWRWRLLYALDYGSHVLSGGACVTWSRWFYDNRDKYRLAAFMNRLLNHFEEDHGKNAGPVLWGTKDCALRWRLTVPVLFLTVAIAIKAWVNE